MLKSYFKIAYRNIVKNKIYSTINILGLAVGLSCTILILLWVNDEISFDKFNKNGKDIFRVVGDWKKWNWEGFEGSPEPLAQAVKEQIPEVIDAVRIAPRLKVTVKSGEKTFYEEGGIIADPSLFRIFSFSFLEGNPEKAFNEVSDIVITQDMANKYFGNEDPIGKVLEIEGQLSKVTGVINNIPSNSHLQFSFVSSFKFIRNLSNYGTDWSSYNFLTYMLLHSGSNTYDISRKITDICMKNNSAPIKDGARLWLQPLYDVYLNSKDNQRSFVVAGNSTYVYAFSIVAFFILLIACINFMNLTTARSMNRSKEIGMRKTLGAKRAQLIKQFLGESVIISLFSGIIAVFIVEMLLPSFNNLSGKHLGIDYLDTKTILSIGVVVLLTGIISGSYPALLLSALENIKIIKGKNASNAKGGYFRKALVILQFSLSISLIAGTVIVNNQLKYIQNKNLGFDKNNVVYIPIKGELGKKYELLKSRLMQNSSFQSVSAQTYLLAKTNYHISGSSINWDGKDQSANKDIDFILSGIDYDLFKTLNMAIVEGRPFSLDFSSDINTGIILNEEAVKEMGITSPVGKKMAVGKESGIIVGVVSDANFRSLHHKIQPYLFYLADFSKIGKEGIVFIKISGNKVRESLSYLKSAWDEINPGLPFEYSFLNETYDQLYKIEKRTEIIFNYFSILAIFISCLGLFGMVSFSVERSTKEIGIRKTLGASVFSIVFLLNKQLLKLVLLANIIAWPVTFYLMTKWLQNFAYSVDLEIWVYILSGLVAFVIALITVSSQTIMAARANPVESLKYE